MPGLMLSKNRVYFFAGFISIILSIWSSLKESVINPDAICYLQSAASMNLGLDTAMHVCDQAKWPFYSALIFGFAHLTSLSFLHSADVLDGLFSLISVLTFIRIVQFLQPSKRILWCAALVILLAHEFNDVRVYIIRDHGFWAFYLVSVLFLLQYFRGYKLIHALGWSSAIIIAALFRVEGIIFLIALPLLVLFYPDKKFISRIRSYLTLNALTLAIIAFGAAFLIFHAHQTENFGRLHEVKFQLFNSYQMIADRFFANANIIGQQVLSQYAVHDAAMILGLVLVVWYFISVIGNLSLIYSFLVIFAWSKKLLRAEKSDHWVLWAYAFINVVVTAIFLAENMFLSKRYLMALSLTLMLWAPFALDYFFSIAKKTKWPVILVLFFMILWSLGGIFDFGYSKQYIRDAGDWLAQNVPAKASLYSNDYQVMYYSGHFGNAIFEKSKAYSNENIYANSHLKHYDYVALRVKKQDSMDFKKLGQKVQEFSNKRGDKVVIFKVH